MHEFCAASGRMTYVVNLDPAADHFEYPVAFGEYVDITIGVALSDSDGIFWL